MNKIPNRKAICDVLLKEAETDKDIVVLCSDSRGSASLAPFADAYPQVLHTVAKKLLQLLLHASFPQEAMSNARSMLHTPTQM